MRGFGVQELMIVLLIAVLLFGAARLPKLARSLREARDEFQKGSDEADASASDAADKKEQEQEKA